MNRKDRGKKGFSNNPWKHNEPGIRINKKTFDKKNKGMIERIDMEKKSKQIVKIYPHKIAFGFVVPKRFKSFTIVFEGFPLKKEEFYARMKLAFPDCVWKGEKFGF